MYDIVSSLAGRVLEVVRQLEELARPHIRQSTWQMLDLAVSIRSCPTLKYAVEELIVEIAEKVKDENTRLRILELCKELVRLMCFDTCLRAVDAAKQTSHRDTS